MFDLGIDKMIVVAVLVGLIMGPERLRELRRALPRHIGRLHAMYQQGRAQVVDELNELAPDWREYDPRPLHPRRILKDIASGATESAVPTAGPNEDSGGAAGEASRGFGESGDAARSAGAGEAAQKQDASKEGRRVDDDAYPEDDDRLPRADA
ncbi:twin-arginine translocase TatA/TatE family subunit [Microbacterium sp. NPDC007973]|uniref:Sec-independent protein translocase subunit TatA/TatB n=1 Tax=Microbacterium sp. NPDC007973 TaxID=3364182 RepID=UPI0036F05423